MKALERKTALVTGAERGIGRAIALRLAADGAAVIVNYLADAVAAAAVVAEIAAAGAQAYALQADVSDPAQVDAMFGAIPELHVLVNNAGVGTPGMLGQIDPAVFDSVFAVNVRGVMLCAQAAIARMPAGGRIVNISSSTAVHPIPGMSAYVASKAAVRALTDVWAKELGARKITVNSVLPGFNATESNAREFNDPATRKAIEDMTTLGRFGQPEDIADVVHALTTPAMGWVTGQCIEASGGFKL